MPLYYAHYRPYQQCFGPHDSEMDRKNFLDTSLSVYLQEGDPETSCPVLLALPPRFTFLTSTLPEKGGTFLSY